MPSLSALTPIHASSSASRSPTLPMVSVPARVQTNPQRHSQLPAQPATIPAQSLDSESASSSSPLPLQCKLAIGSVDDPLEAEADAIAERVAGGARTASMGKAAPSMQRSAAGSIPSVAAPPIVHEALHTSGQPLDTETRAFMEPRIGHDLSGVRIHTGPRAEESARAVHALAYTVGADAVFAMGQYNPRSSEGRRLLAHELSHTVQQKSGRANLQSAPILQRQPQQSAPTDTSSDKSKTDEVTITVPWDLLHRQLTLPSLLAPRQQQPSLPSPGTLTLGGIQTPSTPNPYFPSLGFSPQLTQPGGTGLQPPSLPPGLIPPAPQPGPLLTPTPGSSSGSSGAAPAAPSRLSLHDFGPISVGLRLGFPEMKDDDGPDAQPSASKESIKRAEILNFIITGQPPSEYQLDAGKLIGAVWGIFSDKIAPDVARKIAAGMSSKGGGSGPVLQLDATLLISPSGGKGGGPGGGGGITATLTF
jgi:hypothetical protein